MGGTLLSWKFSCPECDWRSILIFLSNFNTKFLFWHQSQNWLFCDFYCKAFLLKFSINYFRRCLTTVEIFVSKFKNFYLCLIANLSLKMNNIYKYLVFVKLYWYSSTSTMLPLKFVVFLLKWFLVTTLANLEDTFISH